eukprot:1159472-Pelagomonas_calceolata.AAC.18
MGPWPHRTTYRGVWVCACLAHTLRHQHESTDVLIRALIYTVLAPRPSKRTCHVDVQLQLCRVALASLDH